jgi:signal transduction histidine kinase
MKTNLKWSILLMVKCITFVLLFSTESVGQKYADSVGNQLKKLLQMSSTDERDSLIIYTAYVIIDGSKKPESTLYLDSLRRFAENSKWKKAMGFYYYIKANKHLNDKEIYAAFNAFEKSLVEFRALKDEVNMLLVDNRFTSLIGWNMIENVLEPNVQKKYISYLQETIALAKAKKDTAVWANVELTLGGFYIFVQKDFKNCIRHGDIVLNLVENKNIIEWFDYYHIALLGKSLGILNLDEPKGLKMIEDLRNICEKNLQNPKAKYVICQLGTFTGRYFLDKKDYKKALKYANYANKYRFWGNFPYFDNVLNKLLYECHKGLNNQSQAFKYLELVKKYEDEADHKRMNENYAEWQLKYEDEKQKSQIQTLENQKLTQTRNILSLAGLFALGIIGYVFWNNQKLKKKTVQIQEALLKGQTTERKRMASELHDNISNKILGVKMRVEMLENEHFTEKEKNNYEATLGFIDEVYADIRLISHNLLPEELETKGLGIAIENLIKKINLIGKTHFENSFETLQARFSPRLEYEIYNIILELVNNILKHAEAKNAVISIFQENNLLKISVKDNGKGIGNQLINFDSLGLKSIHSRIEALRGKIEILNNNGTEVLIEMPV